MGQAPIAAIRLSKGMTNLKPLMATASHMTLNYALTFAATLTKSFQLIHRSK